MSHKHATQASHAIDWAETLAPALRDKFDFSKEDDFKEWAELSWKAAKVFAARQTEEYEKAKTKDDAETKAAEAAAAKAQENAKEASSA